MPTSTEREVNQVGLCTTGTLMSGSKIEVVGVLAKTIGLWGLFSRLLSCFWSMHKEQRNVFGVDVFRVIVSSSVCFYESRRQLGDNAWKVENSHWGVRVSSCEHEIINRNQR